MTDQNEKDLFAKIVNHATKNERIAWKRKHKKLQEMIEEKISPLEDQILELTMTKMAAMDEAIAIRDVLVSECVHAKEFLVQKDDYVLCKFCDAKLKVNV